MQHSWLELVPMETASFGEVWEGRVVEGRFPLLKRLGGTENCGLYLTVLQGLHEAIIQLISTEDAQAETDIAQWTFAQSLSHPNLAKVLAAGRCVIDGKNLVYVVGEPSSTNLAKTIENGRLEAGQAKEIFNPIVDALEYLHSHGVVHGHLSPSNIHFAGSNPRLLLTDLLIAGPVKRSISPAGNHDAPELRRGEATAAADTWSLGATIWEAMTQAPPSWDLWRDEEPEVPASLPSPFREIVQECLRADPLRRCTLASVKERLSADNAMPLSEGSIPLTVEKPIIDDPGVDRTLSAQAAIAAEEVAVTYLPAPRFSEPDEVEKESSSETALFSGTLTHFEDAHLPRSRVAPYAIIVLAVIAIGAVWLVREHQAGASSTVAEKSAMTTPATQNEATAPASLAPEGMQPPQTEPTTGVADSQQQAKDAPQAQPAAPATQTKGVSQPESGPQPTQSEVKPQAEKHDESAVNQPVPLQPVSVDREPTHENLEGTVEKRIMPAVSPGAREGMTRPVEVLIRVSVNRDGKVLDAAYVVPGPGNYFARVAQRAALSWKFKPPVQNGEPERSVWMLKFSFERKGTEASATAQED